MANVQSPDEGIDLSGEISFEDFRTVEPDEAASLGLPRAAHGLILLTENGVDWALATADMQFFGIVVAAKPYEDLERVILHTGGKTWQLIFGWPPPGVGFTPKPHDPERH